MYYLCIVYLINPLFSDTVDINGLLKSLPQKVKVTLKEGTVWTFLFNAACPRDVFMKFVVVAAAVFVSIF